jgi:hypothetical protein
MAKTADVSPDHGHLEAATASAREGGFVARPQAASMAEVPEQHQASCAEMEAVQRPDRS